MYELSIIIATKNSSDTIEETLKSLEPLQNSLPIEIIVIDDGSTDNTITKCSNFVNVKCIKNPGPRGKSNARNYGIKCSSSELICVLDSDDLIVSPVVLDSVRKMQSLSHIDMIFGKRIDFGIVGSNLIKIYGVFPNQFRISEIQEWFSRDSNPITHSGTIFRKNWFNRVGRYDNRKKNVEDFDLWIRGFFGNNYLFSDEIVSYYRITNFGIGGIRNFDYWKVQYLNGPNRKLDRQPLGSTVFFINYIYYSVKTLLKYLYFVVNEKQLIRQAGNFVQMNRSSLNK